MWVGEIMLNESRFIVLVGDNVQPVVNVLKQHFHYKHKEIDPEMIFMNYETTFYHYSFIEGAYWFTKKIVFTIKPHEYPHAKVNQIVSSICDALPEDSYLVFSSDFRHLDVPYHWIHQEPKHDLVIALTEMHPHVNVYSPAEIISQL